MLGKYVFNIGSWIRMLQRRSIGLVPSIIQYIESPSAQTVNFKWYANLCRLMYVC